MSYCRWSSDHFYCDVYAYESDRGYVVHLKDQRRVGPLAEDPLSWSLRTKGEISPATVQEKYKTYGEALDSAPHVPLELEHAGETFCVDTVAELLLLLTHLRVVGYQFPNYVLEDLIQEMNEDDDQGSA